MPTRKSALTRWLHYLLLFVWIGIAGTSIAWADAPAALREKYASLGDRLQQSPFKRPLLLDSTETPERVQGEIHAVIDYPFDLVKASLNHPGHWCDVMILHINTKYCRAVTGPSGTTLKVHIGRKIPQDLADSERLDFQFNVVAATPDYLEITLHAEQGPVGTSDYRIRMKAVALPNARTFLNLSYSYATDISGRLAMEVYLATIGSDKLGFTVVKTLPDGQPEFIHGIRGVVERNTMRYYLAIDAYLQAERAAPADRLEKRLQTWFTAVEKYPRQLHEMERTPYLEMKRAEVARQQAAD